MPVSDVRSIQRRRQEVAARLRRVERVLERWDRFEAGEPVVKPLLRRDALVSLRGMLVDVLGKLDRAWALDEAWERRN